MKYTIRLFTIRIRINIIANNIDNQSGNQLNNSVIAGNDSIDSNNSTGVKIIDSNFADHNSNIKKS